MPKTIIRLLGLALLVAAMESQALTLGRLRGAALIGQSLDVSVQIQTDADESASSLCLEAEVFHADARQDPSRVQLSIEPASAGQTSNVRIRSTNTIDEPVVTVYLRAGCNQKTTRRYVMLADVITDQAPAAPAPAPQVPLVAPVPTPPAPARPEPAATTGSGTAARSGSEGTAGTASTATNRATGTTPAKAPVKRAAPAAPRKAAAPAPKVATPAPGTASTPAAEKLAAGRNAGQSRLKLDPLEILSERVASLETTTANAPAEQAARETRDAQRLQALENSVKNLLAVATRNEASMADLRVRLQQAESDRYSNPLVWALGGLLLLCLAGIAYLLGRRNTGASGSGGGNWWSGGAQEADADAARAAEGAGARRSGFAPMSSPSPLTGPDSLMGTESTHQQTQRAGPPSKAAPITQVDVSLVEMSESTFDRLMQSGTTHSAVRKPRPAEAAAAPVPSEPGRRLINSDDLFDIRQQAEFFVSLGQTDQAVRILENRISESGESSPLAYLDLMKIFHSLGLKADFRQVREDFNQLFNVRVPEFSGFDNEGRDLEDYPDVLETLTAVWGKPEILANIEAMLFRDQWNGQREPVDLAAFRDLLMLHAVAYATPGMPDVLQEAAERSIPRSPFSPASKFMPQALAPTSANAPLPELDVAGDVDLDLDLDLDLSEPALTVPVAGASAALADPVDPGNLIDFDLPSLPDDKATPKPGA